MIRPQSLSQADLVTAFDVRPIGCIYVALQFRHSLWLELLCEEH